MVKSYYSSVSNHSLIVTLDRFYKSSGRFDKMPVIRMDILAEVYARYNFAIHEKDKSRVIEEGVKNVLLRLRRYSRSPDRYGTKSKQAMKELEAVLERFYYQDKSFTKLVHSKANAYILKQTILEKNPMNG